MFFFITEKEERVFGKRPANLWVLDALGIYDYIIFVFLTVLRRVTFIHRPKLTSAPWLPVFVWSIS